jgi:ribosomal protein S18 acetylase RimI-like enzyme
MESIEELARSHGIPFVRLDAFTTNPFSNAFYRSIGYQKRIDIDLRGTGLTLYEKDLKRI